MNKIVVNRAIKRNIRGYLMLFGLLSLAGTLQAASPAQRSDDSAATYDYTLQNCPNQVGQIADERYLDIEEMPQELTTILSAILTQPQAHLPQLLAVITYDPAAQSYNKYLFSSNGLLTGSKAQEKAHNLNYHLIKASEGPVVWQVLSFLGSQPNLEMIQIAAPEDAPLCFNCGLMASHLFGQDPIMRKSGCQGKPFPTTAAPASAVACFYSDLFTDQQRQLVITNVGEQTFPPPVPEDKARPSPQDDSPMGAATSSVRNNVPIQPTAQQNQLHPAVQFDFPIEAIWALLTDPQTDVNALDSSGKTPLDYANQGSNIYTLLVGHDAKTSEELKAPVVRLAKENTDNYNNEDDQKAQNDKPNPAVAPLPQDQLLIPANGHCLYSTVIMGYLLPVRNDLDEATKRIDQLFGMQPAEYLNQLCQILQDPTYYLSYLHSDAFGRLVTDFMARMRIKKGTWGGPDEIRTIATKLKVNIQEYYPDPDNRNTLLSSDLTKPAEAAATITLHIVRDRVHAAEVLPPKSALDNPHYQHYRLKYTFTQPQSSPKQGDPTDVADPIIQPRQEAKKGNHTPPAPHPPVSPKPQAHPSKKIDTSQFNQKVQQYKKELHELLKQAPPILNAPKATKNSQKFNHASYTSDQIRNVAYELATIDQMPPCIERKIKQLICYARFLQQQKQGIKEKIYLSNGQILTMDKDIFLQLLQDFQSEKSLKNETEKQYINTVVQAAKEEDWSKAKNLLRSVKKKIQPLDLQETFWLVKKAEEAADLVTGQQTILFIGNTGAGKSTIIHTLAGSKMGMKTVTVEKNGKFIKFTHIAPIEIYDKRLEAITTSPIPVSETRYITAFPLTLKEHGIKRAPMSTVWLCDTPGFKDSRGAELDIANSISVVKAFQQCKEIKPVLLIPYSAMGDNMVPLRQLVNLLIKTLPKIEDELDTFFYIFTHVQTEEQQEEIKSKFEYEVENAKENDPACQPLIEDISEKLDEEKEAIFFNPLKDDRKKVLKALVNSGFIKNPAGKFNSYTTLETKSTVDDQIEKQRKQILAAADQQNYTLVAYKLDELLRLHQILPSQASIKQKYKDVTKALAELWDQQYEKAQKKFREEIEIQPQLQNSTLKSYYDTYQAFLQAEKMRSQHIPNAKEGMAFLVLLGDVLAQLRATIEQSPLEAPQLPPQLDKIKQISTLFPSFKPFVTHTFESLEKTIKTQERALQQAIANKQFAEAYKLIVTLQYSTSLQPFLPNMTVNPLIYSDQLLTQLTEIQNNAIDIILNTQLDDPDLSLQEGEKKLLIPTEIAQLKEVYTTLSQVAEYFSDDLDQQGLCTKIKALQTSLLSRIGDYVNACAQKINLIFQEEQIHSFTIIHAYQQSIKEIRTIEDVEMHTAKDYKDITKKIDLYVYQIFQNIQRLLSVFENFFEKDAKIDYEKLFFYVHYLKKNKAFIDEGENLFTRTKKQFSIHMERIEAQVGDVEIDYASLPQISRLFNHLKELQKLKDIMPKITQQSKRIYETLSSNFKVKLNEIQDQFDVEKSSTATQRSAEIYLRKLQDGLKGRSKVAQTLLQAYQETTLPDSAKATLQDETGRMLFSKGTHQLQPLKEALNQLQAKIDENETSWTQKQTLLEGKISKMEVLEQLYHKKKEESSKNNWGIGNLFFQAKKSTDADDWLKKEYGQSIEKLKEKYRLACKEREKIEKDFQGKITFLKNRQKKRQKQYDHLKSMLATYEQGAVDYQSQIARCQKSLEELGYPKNHIENFIESQPYLKEELDRVNVQITGNKGTQYCFKPLNPNKARLALHFLEQAQRIFPIIRVHTSHSPSPKKANLNGIAEEKQAPRTKNAPNTSIRKHIACTLDKLQEYLTQYGKTLQKEVMHTFSALDSITDFEKEKDKIQEKSQALFSRFKEISYLAANYSNILSLFGDDIANNMKSRLEKLSRDIAEKLTLSEERKEKVALANAIKFVRELRDLDPYLDKKEFFHGLYVKSRQALYGQVGQSAQEIIAAIEKKDYRTAVKRIHSLSQLANSGDQNAANNTQTIQEHLYGSLQDLLKDTCRSINSRNEDDIKPDSVEQLKGQLEIAKLAQECFFKKGKYKHPILDDDQQQQLHNLNEKIESALARWMQDVTKSIQSTIRMHNFVTAENKIKQYNYILRCLGDSCPTYPTEKVNQKDNHPASQGDKKLKATIDTELDGLVKYYATKALETYTSKSPEDLYKKLEEAKEFGACYSITWQKIAEKIKTKFEQLLEKSLKEKNSIRRENYLKLGKRTLNTLPSDLKGHLEARLEDTKKQIIETNETLTRDINEVFTNISTDRLNKMWTQLRKNQSAEHIDDFKKKLKEKVMEIEENYKKYLREDNIRAAYTELCELSAYATSFEKEKDIRLQEVKQRAIKKLEEKMDKNKQIIQQHLNANMSPQQVQKIRKAFLIMNQCKQCYQEKKLIN